MKKHIEFRGVAASLLRYKPGCKHPMLRYYPVYTNGNIVQPHVISDAPVGSGVHWGTLVVERDSCLGDLPIKLTTDEINYFMEK